MFDFISLVFEAVLGYFIGRFRAKHSTASHISLIIFSLALGLAFFCTFGIYELIFPAPDPIGNKWAGLLYISLGTSFFTYLILLVDYLIKKGRRKTMLNERITAVYGSNYADAVRAGCDACKFWSLIPTSTA